MAHDSFLQTIPGERRDFCEWHRGRPHYAVWALDVDVPQLRARVELAQGLLGESLLDAYRRQPHVTVGLCGFPAALATDGDDFSAAQLAREAASLRAAKTGAFVLEIGAADSFASAPYLAVDDVESGLLTIRRRLLAAGAKAMHDYRPHVTLGLYRRSLLRSDLMPMLARIGHAPLRIQVGRLSWMAYEAADIGGPLMTVATLDLATGQWRVGGSPDLPQYLTEFARSVLDAC